MTNSVRLSTISDQAAVRLLEDLPNELFYDLFPYLEVRQLYRSFFGLNHRLDTLLYGLKKNYLVMSDVNDTFDETSVYASRITHMWIRQEYSNLSFHCFRNTIRAMSLDGLSHQQFQQLDQLTNLTHLKINSLNMRRSLILVSLRPRRYIETLSELLNLITHPLRSLSSVTIPLCIRDDFCRVLVVAPNLFRLNVNVFRINSSISDKKLVPHHNLRSLNIQWYIGVNHSDLDFYLSQVPFLQSLHLSVRLCTMPDSEFLYELLHQMSLSIRRHLPSLRRFSCSFRINFVSLNVVFDPNRLDAIFTRAIRIKQSGCQLKMLSKWAMVR
ncbi:unnamed protein product [Rotaria magnacalcarata]|uniref:F-box domain-containing protein n=1 Tax=Rotaria magnacalcarata TaxID=392030 RepID=A0A814GUC4_9BILA|nr:unnamed protein product [Rotaria magnacalcarata]CAF1258749.1 unnamed protein product [Rotaria magnacalcarata]CAF1919869.1 unnamed protein product [Rotaria magnacalcarata]CAF4399871.1 unnamed protein product [Rotaria magnacalcarata]CAF4400523.1 unnamed protein product [Rotaria magnacalcarata]